MSLKLSSPSHGIDISRFVYVSTKVSSVVVVGCENPGEAEELVNELNGVKPEPEVGLSVEALTEEQKTVLVFLDEYL